MHDKRKWEPVDGADGRRLKRTAWLFLALIAIVLGQVAWIQIFNRDAFLKDMPRYRRLSTLISKRGMIYDRR
jgi:cell division protein FtsI/penicillin-binding protein 2